MASPEVLDFARLVNPIPGDNPAGKDLRLDPSPTSAYYTVKGARSTARAAERQLLMGDEEAGGTPPDWRPVLQHGAKLIAEQSKDLEIVAYMIEASLRRDGFAGLRDGFRLARELCAQFWDPIYPLPDEEGIETRLGPLTGLNGDDAEGTLIAPIGKVPLTEGANVGPFAYADYLQASALAQMIDAEAREKRLEQGAVSMQKIEKAVSETPAAFFTNLVEDLKQCQEEWAKLIALLEDKTGGRPPPSSTIRDALTNCLETLQNIARDKLASAAGSAEEEAAGATAAGEGPAAAGDGVPTGAIRNREEAFRTLLKVADFFRRTEPHTPVSYALEQAVRWGRMGLPELLTELIQDDSARQQYFRQVGIRPPEGAS